MILVDTSVWIDHLRNDNAQLNSLLLNTAVASRVADDKEVLFFIEHNDLMGRGIGYIDAHLLASVSLSKPARLWTVDRKLSDVAIQLGLA